MPDDRKPSPQKKNPTRTISIFIVVVVLLVIGTLFFNAIREKREFEQQNAPSVTNGAKTAVPAIGASQ